MLWPLSLSESETRVISTSQAPSGGSAASPKLEIWETKQEQKKKKFYSWSRSCSEFHLEFLFRIFTSLTIWTTKFWNLLLFYWFQPFIDFSNSSMTGSDHFHLPEPCRFRGLLGLPSDSADIRCLPNPQASTIPWPTVWAVDQTRLLPVRREL